MAGVDALKNLGPTSVELFRAVGVTTAEEVRELGAVMAFRLLRHRHGSRVSVVMLYALEGAIQDRPFGSFSEAEKAALRAAAEDD